MSKAVLRARAYFCDPNVAQDTADIMRDLVDELQQVGRHRDILATALSEIKATDDGGSDHPIGFIIRWCIEEVKKLNGKT